MNRVLKRSSDGKFLAVTGFSIHWVGRVTHACPVFSDTNLDPEVGSGFHLALFEKFTGDEAGPDRCHLCPVAGGVDQWTTEGPDKSGLWWFLGVPDAGAMAAEYEEGYLFEPLLYMVSWKRNDDCARFVRQSDARHRLLVLQPFDREAQREGQLGVWRMVEAPDFPDDHVLPDGLRRLA